MKKKLLLLLTALLLSGASVFAQVVDGGTTGPLTWNISNDTLYVNGSGTMLNYSPNNTPWHSYRDFINAVIIGDSVTSIGSWAFENCSNLTSITIPENITSIEWGAFENCNSLQTINFNAINCITITAPLWSKLTTVNIGDRVETIPDGAFQFLDSLTSVTIPNSVTTIGDCAFCYSALTSVTIGNSVTTIGNQAFYSCSSLASITTYAITPPTLESNTFIGVPTNVPIYIPCLTYNSYHNAYEWNNFTYFIVNGPTSDTTSYHAIKCYNVPYTDDNFATPIYYAGTYYQILANSLDCDSVVCLTLIENSYNNTYYSASICQGSSYTDNNFTDLTEAGVYSITLLNVNLCDSTIILTLFVTPMLSGTTGDLTWTLCDGTLTISGSGAMPDYAYSGTNMPPWASYRNSIRTVILQTGVTNIGSSAFTYCSNLTSVTIPNSVTTIGDNAFASCGLTSVTIPDSVITIGNGAFQSCNLTSITIPNNVKTIGVAAFAMCSSLQTINFNAINCTGMELWPELWPPPFYNCPALTTLNIGNDVDTIPSSVFSYCISLTSVTIPNNVTTIGGGAFSYCISLTSVTIPNSVTTIGGAAFSGCSSLTSVTIPNSVTTIEDGVFWYCISLTSVTIPNNVTTIGNWAFSGCSSLTSVTIPNSVTTIGDVAFRFCGLTSVTIPNNVTTIGYSAFYGCEALASVTIGNSVTTIGGWAFENCSNLTSVTTYATTPPTLGSNTFTGVLVNIPVYIPCLTYNSYSTAYGWNNFTNFIVNGPTTADTTSYNAIKCYNVPYTDHNFTTPIYSIGTYYVTLPNVHGCDSVVSVTLTENPYIPATYYSATICQGSSYTDEHFTNLTQADTYETVLQNVNGCDSIVRLHLYVTFSPEQQLCMISVDNNNHNEIVWKRESEAVSYNVYREGIVVGNYELIANVPYSSPNSFVDMESNAKIRSYRYKVAAIDTCGNESVLSESHKTMHLTIGAGMNNSWNLIWTAYEGTEYATYNIYRARGNANNPGEFSPIGTMPAGNTSYTDFSAPNGNVYYMVEIMLNAPCDVGKSLSSIKSNIATNTPDVGIVETHCNASLQVYPNPTNGQLKIKNYELRDGIIEIFDVYGRNVLSHTANLTPHTANLTPHTANLTPHTAINISHLASGIYFLRVDGQTVKVVKN